MANLYERRDQVFSVTVYDTDGTTVIPASTYLNAQYRIYKATDSTPSVSKSLGSGITVVGNVFEVALTKTEMQFSTNDEGPYKHLFCVGATATEVLPAIFDEAVTIVEGIPV